jgi:hypothetical protein
MIVNINGCEIQLTEDQIQKIENHKRKLERASNSFHGTLILFGFRRIKGEKAYSHPNGWYAEVTVHNENWIDLWMVGNGLKTSSFLGGWIYSEPNEVAQELQRVLNRF